MNDIKSKVEELRKVDPQEMEAALRIYCRFHLKSGDLEAVPELRKYLQS